MENARHIENEPDLLDLMLSDMSETDNMWRPTSYWDNYVENAKRTIKTSGLDNFRGSEDSKQYKAFVLPFSNEHDSTLLKVLSVIPAFSRLLSRIRNLQTHFGYLNQNLMNVLYYYIRTMDKNNVLVSIDDSLTGNPSMVFKKDGREFTFQFLNKMLQYLYVDQYVDFGNIESFLEIGGGYGAQAEVILKANPNMRCILIDIPPMSYITTQYMKSCFPGEVIDYEETRGKEKIKFDDFGDKRIMVLCPWQLPMLDEKWDLFWNAASFQEMEKFHVKNYIKYINDGTQKYVYLYTRPEGHPPGTGGQKEPVSAEFIISNFDKFEKIKQKESSPSIINSDSISPSFNYCFFNYESYLLKKK